MTGAGAGGGGAAEVDPVEVEGALEPLDELPPITEPRSELSVEFVPPILTLPFEVYDYGLVLNASPICKLMVRNCRRCRFAPALILRGVVPCLQ